MFDIHRSACAPTLTSFLGYSLFTLSWELGEWNANAGRQVEPNCQLLYCWRWRGQRQKKKKGEWALRMLRKAFLSPLLLPSLPLYLLPAPSLGQAGPGRKISQKAFLLKILDSWPWILLSHFCPESLLWICLSSTHLALKKKKKKKNLVPGSTMGRGAFYGKMFNSIRLTH